MPRLTKRVVEGAEPQEKDYFLWDEEIPGFGLRVFASGRRSYMAQYRQNGRTRRISIGPHGRLTPDEARKEARAILGDVAKGGDPAELRDQGRRDPTIAQLCDTYLKDGPIFRPSKKATSWEADKRAIDRHIKPLLGTYKLRSITRRDAQYLLHAVTEGKTKTDQKTGFRGRAIVRGGPSAATRAVGVLSAMLSFAVEKGLLDTNPVLGVRKPKPVSKERFLNAEELARLGAALSDSETEGENLYAVAAIRLLLFTGARKSEILTLKWEFVDLQNNWLRLPDSKTGAKVVPLGAPAKQILENLPRIDGADYVFPSVKDDGPLVGLQKIWEGIRAKAKLDDVRLHDLRHSFASMAVMGGNSLYIVGKILGHKQSRTTEIYAHLADDPLKAAADATASQIASLLNRGSAADAAS